MTQDEASRIKKYFSKFPKWTVGAIIVGLPLIPAYGLGLILIGIGIWGIVSWYRKPTDQEMDAWIEEALKSVRARALNKSGLDPSELIGDPVVVYGPRFWNIGGAAVGIRKGNDGIVRFMPLGVTVINF